MKKVLIAVPLLLLLIIGCKSEGNTEAKAVEDAPTEQVTE